MYGQKTARSHTVARALDGIGVRLIVAAALFLWFGWWIRQFWVSLGLAVGLTCLLSWGYYITRRKRIKPDNSAEGLAMSIRMMTEEKLGDYVEDIFDKLPDFTHLYRTAEGILAKVGHQAVLIGWHQPTEHKYTSLGHWVAFLKSIRQHKADRGILISGGSFDRECKLAAQTGGKPQVELVDARALARLAAMTDEAGIPQQPLLPQKQNPGWLQRLFYVLVRPGRCIFYAAILLIMARFFRIYAWYYFGAAALLVIAAGAGIWMRYRNRCKWNPLLPEEERRYDTSEYRSAR